MTRCLLPLLLLVGTLLGAAPARADIWTWPIVRWFVGFGKLDKEQARLEKVLPCDKATLDRYEVTGSRFSCLLGARQTVQVIAEDASTEPGTVKRIVFAWRSTTAIAGGEAQGAFAQEDRTRARNTLKAVADLYVPGKSAELQEMLGKPSGGQVEARGVVATYARVRDQLGERFLVEFRDENSRRLREKETANDQAGIRLCQTLISRVPRFANLQIQPGQRARQEDGYTAYIVVSDNASLICEFYPTGYYRILAAEKDSENYLVAAHGRY